MPVSPPELHRGWTLDDLDLLPDDGQRYELVDGGLVMTPPPTQRHQMLADDLRERLQAAAPTGWRARLEFPIPFDEDTQRTPDVVVHRWPLQRPRDDQRNPVGPADVGLIVEVVSPSTRGPTASPSPVSTPRLASPCSGGWRPSPISSCSRSS